LSVIISAILSVLYHAWQKRQLAGNVAAETKRPGKA
jgi:hypothetical protein